MSDPVDSVPGTPELVPGAQEPAQRTHRTDTRPLPRRAVLGVTAMATAAVAVGTTTLPAAADSHRPSPSHGHPGHGGGDPGDHHVEFTRFTGPGFLRGRFEGTRHGGDGLRIGRPTTTRDYTDSFADDPTAVTYDQASWISPVVHPPFAFTELISSWNVDTPDKTWVEILVRGTDDTGTRSGWYVLGRWCADDPADGGAIHRTSVDAQGTDVATVYTDTFHARTGRTFASYQLQINLLRPHGARQSPTVRQLAAVASALPDETGVPVSPPGRAVGHTLNVPTFSQEIHIGHYPQWDNGGEAWCSATSTAMVLKYWHTGPSTKDLTWVDPPVDAEVDFSARNVFDYTYDGCGNWPFNTAYAGRYGLEGFVTRLRSFTEAEELVRAGIPVIISVSFKKGDLDGAGYGTNGHLMVVVGFAENGDVVVNDPASHLIRDDAQVRTTYKRGQLENAWVPHSGGTVYLIHPRRVRLPQVAVRSEPNW